MQCELKWYRDKAQSSTWKTQRQQKSLFCDRTHFFEHKWNKHTVTLRERQFVGTLLATGEEYFVLVVWIRYYRVACKILCVLGTIKCVCRAIPGNFLISTKEAEFDIVINSCITEPWYWQNHINYILTVNSSLLICQESSTTAILFDVKYAISPLNSWAPSQYKDRLI